MVEDEDKKEEDKFEFTPEGESLGYISSDQARVLAMRTARESPGDYGRRFRNVAMAFEVVQADETDDYYEVTLSFRPQGELTGTPGQEQFFIEKEGDVAHRQVLSRPGRAGWRPVPVSLVAISLVVVVGAAVGGVFAATSGGGGSGDTAPLAGASPTTTLEPPAMTPVPGPTTAAVVIPPVVATATPTSLPTLTATPLAIPPVVPTATPTPASAPTATVPSGTIPSDAVLFRGHRYLVVSASTSWEQAKRHAESLGGHLVTIGDEAENLFVADLAAAQGLSAIRIGLTDQAREGRFVWATGEALSYTNWAPAQPDNARHGANDEDYVELITRSDDLFQRLQWNDVPDFWAYVVEFEGLPTVGPVAVATPTPAPAATLVPPPATVEAVPRDNGAITAGINFTVTTTADTTSCGTPCSLWGAIAVANSGDTIIIPAGTAPAPSVAACPPPLCGRNKRDMRKHS